MNDRDNTIECLKYLRDRAVISGSTITEQSDWIVRLCDEVLELLKEQEPRVLTIEEVVNSDAPVIVDSYDMPLYYASFEPEFSNETWARFYTLGEEGFTQFLIEDYNKANMWRCWSARPTDELREAVPWGE